MVRRILNRWSGAVIWEGEADTVKAALHAACATDADLTDAVLTGAVLRGVDLTDAVLTGADLTGADLTDAVLTGAVLRGAAIPPTANVTGESWADYLTTVVPALLVAGGKTLDAFGEHFECHTWENCPMAFAFDVRGIDGVPLLLRPRAQQFITLFDAGLILWPLPTAEQIEATFKTRSVELEKARAERLAAKGSK